MIIGWGKIGSRKVFVTADDFSVRGGHADGGIQGKAAYGEVCSPPVLSAWWLGGTDWHAQALATQHRVPLVRPDQSQV